MNTSSTFLPCFCHRGPRYRGNQSPTANVVPDRAKCHPSSSCSLSGPRRGCPGLPQLRTIRERQTWKRARPASLPNFTQTHKTLHLKTGSVRLLYAADLSSPAKHHAAAPSRLQRSPGFSVRTTFSGGGGWLRSPLAPGRGHSIKVD